MPVPLSDQTQVPVVHSDRAALTSFAANT